jgi:hypothetical protein
MPLQTKALTRPDAIHRGNADLSALDITAERVSDFGGQGLKILQAELGISHDIVHDHGLIASHVDRKEKPIYVAIHNPSETWVRDQGGEPIPHRLLLFAPFTKSITPGTRPSRPSRPSHTHRSRKRKRQIFDLNLLWSQVRLTFFSYS